MPDELEPLYVRVSVYDTTKPADSEPDQEYVWDYFNPDHRKKFNGTLKWAMREGHEFVMVGATYEEYIQMLRERRN